MRRISFFHFVKFEAFEVCFLGPHKDLFLELLIGHFRVPPGLCFKTRVGAQPLIWKPFFILMQIKLIFTRKVVHLASFWKGGFLELGSGLFIALEKCEKRCHMLEIMLVQGFVHRKLKLLNFLMASILILSETGGLFRERSLETHLFLHH